MSEELQFRDLRDFMTFLRREGELVEVEAEVDPHLEAAEIHRRVIAANGPALLFTNPKNASFPLVTNLFGTTRRAEMAFGKRPLRLVKRVVELAETFFPPTAGKLWGARDLGAEILRLGMKKARRAAVLEHVQENFDLRRLPALTCWPLDGGPFITLPLVLTEDPEGRGHNLGMYRLQVHGPKETGMHWQIGKGGGFHYSAAEKKGQSLPVTVMLGGPPALILAAIAPLPENLPELILASLIAGRKLPVTRKMGPHPVVAGCEFALVGRVPPEERKAEGPFGDHYGYYSLRHDYPVFKVDRVAHRAEAVYPATVVGKPRQEDFFIGDLLQELLAPLFPLVMPSVEDLWSYGETGYHSLAAARVRERYRREAMVSAFRILGEGQLSLTKFLLATDGRVNLKDFKATLQFVLERTRPETDLYIFSNLSMDTLDYSGPRVNEGSKGVLLGLGEAVRELPSRFVEKGDLPAGTGRRVVFCPGCLVVGAPSHEASPHFCNELARHPAFGDWPLVIVTEEPERLAADTINFLWGTFTRFEPAADIHTGGARVVRNHVCHAFPIVIDARLKRGFPDELFCDEETARLVSKRWSEYFPSGVEMGDSDRGHLR